MYYEAGDKSGKLLARALREPNTSKHIMGIRGADGSLDVKTDDIAKHFQAYYSKLYNLPAQHGPPEIAGDRTQAIQDYLKQSGLPQLDMEDITQLEEQISSIEIQQAIKALKLGKSPGPDGYTSIYYKTFINILTEPLQKAFNSLTNARPILSDFLSAHITVFPKTDKDTTDCSSYRPISLLNIDLKLLDKILANRLRLLQTNVIGPEQVGFMLGREAKDNIIKALLLTQASHSLHIESLLLSTDTEKAFDRVAWDFMFATCTHIGLNPHMMVWITALYQQPSARIKMNGSLSENVEILNGTRQGCPLSPFLFILSLEPFIRTINKDDSVKGIPIHDRMYKTAAYADDLLFFVTNPHTTLPNLMKYLPTMDISLTSK